MKVAASLDGRTALRQRRQPVDHRPRGARRRPCLAQRAGAMLTGIGTVLDDDPRLDVRLVPHGAPAAARGRRLALADAAGARLLAAARASAGVQRQRRRAPRPRRWRDAGAEVLRLPAIDGGRSGRPAGELARRGVNELHVEAGAGSTAPCCEPAWSTNCWSTWRRTAGRGLGDWPHSDPSNGSAMEFRFLEVYRVGTTPPEASAWRHGADVVEKAAFARAQAEEVASESLQHPLVCDASTK